jgi:uncharacterized repeat protein (TIGR02543 family)
MNNHQNLSPEELLIGEINKKYKTWRFLFYLVGLPTFFCFLAIVNGGTELWGGFFFYALFILLPATLVLFIVQIYYKEKLTKLATKNLGKKVVGFFSNILSPKPVVIQQNKDSQDDKGSPFLKRAKIFLEDEEFIKANEYTEKALDLNPELGEAYLLKILIEYKSSNISNLLTKLSIKELESNKNFIKATKYGSQSFLESLENELEPFRDKQDLEIKQKDAEAKLINAIDKSSISNLNEAIENAKPFIFSNKEKLILQANKRINELNEISVYDEAIRLLNNGTLDDLYEQFEKLKALKQTEEIKRAIENYQSKIVELKNSYYQNSISKIESNKISELTFSLDLLKQISPFKDSEDKILSIQRKISEIRKINRTKFIKFFSILTPISIIFAILLNTFALSTYVISFMTNGGSLVPPISANFNEEIEEPISNKVGYTFDGWYREQETLNEFIFDRMPASNLTLYAKWTVNQYTITFETNGGSNIASITGNYGDAVSAPNNPTKEGYTFNGWYANSNLTQSTTVPTTMPAQNLTIYAKWTINQYTITFDTNGGNAIQTQTNNYNATLNLPTPTKLGHSFAGWFTDVDLSQAATTTMPAQNLTIYAKWTINQYQITFVISPETNKLDNITFFNDEKIINTYFSSSFNFSGALTSSGRVIMWGNNESGQLGIGSLSNPFYPVDITNKFALNNQDRIISLSLGYNHSSAVTSTGRVFMWGGNEYSQLGEGTSNNTNIPVEITEEFTLPFGDKITSLSLGGRYSSALSSLGKIFTWGWNQNGRLGNEFSSNVSSPTEITSRFSLTTGEKIYSIHLSTGGHSAALTSNNRLFMWGNNQYGNIDNSQFANKLTPIDITSSVSNKSIISVSLGTSHSAALTSDNKVITWGRNNAGQLGIGGTSSERGKKYVVSSSRLNYQNITSISLIGSIYSALSSTGQIFIWGENSQGQLADGTLSNSSYPLEVIHNFNIFAKDKIISIGNCFSALTYSGRLFTWGFNSPILLSNGEVTNIKFLKEISLIQKETYFLDFESNIDDYYPNKTGYSFAGWYLDEEGNNEVSFDRMAAQNLTLYAKWIIDV